MNQDKIKELIKDRILISIMILILVILMILTWGSLDRIKDNKVSLDSLQECMVHFKWEVLLLKELNKFSTIFLEIGKDILI